MDQLFSDGPGIDSKPPRHINDDCFWPFIDLGLLRQSLCLDSSISDARLEIAAIGAVTRVNRELAHWRRALREENHATLASVPTQSGDEVASLHVHYVRAVEAATKLELQQHFRLVERYQVCTPCKTPPTKSALTGFGAGESGHD